MANDIVTLFWRGMNASGEIINGGVADYVILATDISVGATFLIKNTKLEIHLTAEAGSEQ
jgi:hypothetical protein